MLTQNAFSVLRVIFYLLKYKWLLLMLLASCKVVFGNSHRNATFQGEMRNVRQIMGGTEIFP